jgi:hypothetical protein
MWTPLIDVACGTGLGQSGRYIELGLAIQLLKWELGLVYGDSFSCSNEVEVVSL